MNSFNSLLISYSNTANSDGLERNEKSVPFSTKCISFGVPSLNSTDSRLSFEDIVLVTILKISSNSVLLDPN